MKWPKSIQSRFVAAYMLLALCSCVLFGIIAVIAVEGIEVHLVDNRLMRVADWALPRYTAGLPLEMPDDLSFYHGDSIPQSLRGLTPGIHEVTVNGVGLNVLAGSDVAGNYVVVDHDSDYEEVEFVVYSMVAAGFLIFLTLSLFLGSYVARRFVSPINILANAVIDTESREELPFLSNEDEIGTLARAFEARTVELRQYLDRERFFTGDVSHELRTPLTIITGSAEILLSLAEQNPDIRVQSERILRAAREAAECVNVLLLLAREPDLIDNAEIPVSEVIAAEIERCRFLTGDKPIKLESRIEADFLVFARLELLAAAVGNLIRNACQYTESGSVVVKVGDRTVTVEDTGPGLPEAVLERIAGQHPLTRQAGSAGSGLGLSLVKRIAEHLGATLSASERSGGGTAISIRFPPDLTKS